MTSGDSPAVARRRVRLKLREFREAGARTQSDVAEAMEWSLSKVIRIESGEVSISPNDLKPLATYLGIKDRALVDELVADAKASRVRRRRWWMQPPFKDHLTGAMARLVEFEEEAAAARFFATYLVPGMLQAPPYADAIFEKWQDDLSDEVIDVRRAARLRRRQAFLTRLDKPKISLLADESIIRRIIGGPAVMRAQLTDLLDLVEDGRIHLRVVPFHSIEAPLPTFGTYDLLYLTEDGDDDNAVIYRELDLTDEIVEDRVKAALHRKRFDQLWNTSMDERATIDLVHERLTELGAARHT